MKILLAAAMTLAALAVAAGVAHADESFLCKQADNGLTTKIEINELELNGKKLQFYTLTTTNFSGQLWERDSGVAHFVEEFLDEQPFSKVWEFATGQKLRTFATAPEKFFYRKDGWPKTACTRL